MADYLLPHVEKSTQTDTGRVDIPSRPPSTVPFLFEDAPKEQIARDPAYLRYGRVALRILVLGCSAAVIGLVANSLVTYNNTRSYSFGTNTQFLDAEPTGDTSAWPTGIVLIPSDIILIVAACSTLVTLVLIPVTFIKDFDGSPIVKEPVYIMLDGIYILSWLAGVVIYKAVSETSTDSLMKYACANSNSLFDKVVKYSTVCDQQNAAFGVGIVALVSEIVLLASFLIPLIQAWRRPTGVIP
ncbi:hypothetical protein NA57DRAFT_81949 [Rhizodiscina lignyota]|uniref:MARVEL domain-containing protein n=1 Tax=Rhizodiscina lignyota TaxID=1504668 RepID=A0A9P4LZP2_9PEZI|nr:hypothetical protein NA57DRAFT_81949 [Rhizodiscina lignyota]